MRLAAHRQVYGQVLNPAPKGQKWAKLAKNNSAVNQAASHIPMDLGRN
jgi:hypothetical protein